MYWGATTKTEKTTVMVRLSWTTAKRTIGRRAMITFTYGLSGVLLAGAGYLFAIGLLSARGQTVAWMVIFFFASAAASSAYSMGADIDGESWLVFPSIGCDEYHSGAVTGAVASAEKVLVEGWRQQYPSHSIGQVEFGPDGALYASGGDGASFDCVTLAVGPTYSTASNWSCIAGSFCPPGR